MTRIRTSVAVPFALLIALVAAPALSGCSMVEGAIEQATGGQVDLGGTTVPDDFPASEVPLFDGPIVNGSSISSGEGQVWNIVLSVPGADAFDTIKTQLEGAGFTYNGTGAPATDEGGSGLFDSEKYGVLVLVAKAGGTGFVANYTVTAKVAG